MRLRDEEPLGDATTGADGRYTIGYPGPDDGAPDSHGNLRVALIGPDGAELATSSIRYRADASETVDLVLPVGASPVSEYERYLADLDPLLHGVRLADLGDADAAFLAGDTRIPPQHLGGLIEAARLQEPRRATHADAATAAAPPDRAPALPAAVWYAWHRQGLDLTPASLWQRPADELLRSIEAAVDQRLVPVELAERLAELGVRIRDHRLEHHLDTPTGRGRGSLRDLLATLPDPPGTAESRTVAEVLVDWRSEPDRLSGELQRAGVAGPRAAAVVRTVRLDELTAGNTALVAGLQDVAGEAANLRGLTTVPPDAWADLAYRHPPAPDATTRGPDSELEYAATVRAKVEQLHPTATLAARLADGSVELPGADVGRFLAANPDFDILTSPLDGHLDAVPEQERASLAATLLAVRRLQPLALRWEHTAALVQTGLASASDIAGRSTEQLVSLFDGRIPADAVRAIHARAATREHTTVAVLGALPRFAPTPVAAMPSTAPTAERLAGHPSAQSLFGSLDGCACGQCRSVLSPAAYLVDLLEFLRRDVPPAFSELLNRRPDVADLELSCGNGEIVLPAIDLALEVLENAVGLPLTVELPAGSDVTAALAGGPLPAAVLAVLRRTAVDVATDLRAATEPVQLQQEGFTAWTVTDRWRRWTLRQSDENLYVTAPGHPHRLRDVPRAGLDLAATVAGLDGGILTGELDSRLRPLLVNDPLTRAAMEPLTVVPLTDGRRWRVAYRVRFTVAGTGDGQLTISASSGAVLVDRVYSAQGVTATKEALVGGTAGGLLATLVQAAPLYLVEAGPDAQTWQLSRRTIETEVRFTPATLTVAALTCQSSRTDPDPLAVPQNRNPAAYERLRAGEFPWALPFDLPLAETRAFLDRAGLTRLELMQLWQSSTAQADYQVAMEHLGLSGRDPDLITTPLAEPVLWRQWGAEPVGGVSYLYDASAGEVVSGPPLTVFGRLSLLLQQSRLSHPNLLDLLDTAFLRGSGVTPIALPPHECRPSSIRLEPVNVAFFDRLHRFVRLWRALGWSIADVDAAVTAFAEDGALTYTTLYRISHLVRLRRAVGLDVDELIDWYGGIGTRDRRKHTDDDGTDLPARFDQLFAHAGVGVPDPDLALNAARDRLTIETTTAPADLPSLDVKLDVMAAAFEVPGPELSALLDGLPLRHGESRPLPLTLDSLSRLYRAARLARALHLRAADFARAVRLTGIEPFPVEPEQQQAAQSIPNPRTAGEFCAAVEVLRSTGFSLAELAYLLRHEPAPGLAIALPDVRVADILAATRGALHAVTDDVDRSTTPDDRLRAALVTLGWYPALVSDVVDDLGVAGAPDPVVEARLRRRLRCAVLPVFAATTDSLGPSFTVPAGLRERCRVEPAESGAGSRIVVSGWVDAPDKEALAVALDVTTHPARRTAVEALGADSDSYVERVARRRLLGDGEITALLHAGRTAAGRYEEMTAAIVRHRRIAAAVDRLAQETGFTSELVGELLLDLLAVPGTQTPAVQTLLDPGFADVDARATPTSGAHPVAFALVRRLHKAGLLAARFGVDARALAGLAGTGPLPAGRSAGLLAIDLNQLPGGSSDTDTAIGYQALHRTVLWARLRARGPDAPALFDAYAAAVVDVDRPVGQRRQRALAVLADAIDVAEPMLVEAADRVFLFGLTFYDPVGVAAVLDLVTALTRLGIEAAQVPALLAAGAPAEGAALARGLLRSRYPGAAWTEVVRPVADRLRERQRDALVDQLVFARGLDSPDQLYEYYLIDVLVAPCADTTRLLSATAAVQLFVNRCLLGLEPAVPAAAVNRRRWDWMRTYRTWEANRRVFLWPQNWLHPELREDASDAFRTVESTLGQGEPSAETAQAALVAFLDDVVELSRVSVVGMYQHRRGSGAGAISDLYLVGRTADRPYRYFWRVCQDIGGGGTRWLPWRRIDLDLPGTHVMPYVLGGDLHLAWPLFRRDETGGAPVWQVQLSVARLTAKGWSEHLVGRDTVDVPVLVNKDERGTFTFTLTVSTEPPAATTVTALPLTSRAVQEAAVVSMYTAVDRGEKIVPRLTSASATNDRLQLWLTVRVLATRADLRPPTYWRAGGAVVWLTVTSGAVTAKAKLETGSAGEVSAVIDASYFASGHSNPGLVVLALAPAFFAGDFTLSVTYGTATQTFVFPKTAETVGQEKRWSVEAAFTLPETAAAPPTMVDPERAVGWDRQGSFVVSAQSGIDWQHGRGPKLLRKLTRGMIYENGVLARSGDSGTLLVGIGAHLMQVRGTPGRFFALPGNPQQGSAVAQLDEREADVLYYRDGAGQYLLQTAPQFKWRITTDGLPLAVRFRADATDLAELFSPATQAITDGGSLLREVHRPLPLPLPGSIVEQGITFDLRSPAGSYHWELFLHLPVLVAAHLSAQRRYAEADRWLRLVFDPAGEQAQGAGVTDPNRFWQFLPFRSGGRPDRIEDLLRWLADPDDDFPGRADFIAQVTQWRDSPFRPHAIARLRPGAYQWNVLFAYLDNLIAWGDDWFRRDTREALVEATARYVQAAQLLGPRPRRIQPQLQPPALTYRSMVGRWDAFADVWYSLADHPLVAALQAAMGGLAEQGVAGSSEADQDAAAALRSTGLTYFCVPHNDRLLDYWDAVEDRLFKIRHCQNIDGVERPLPLYPPPIDPELLVRAVAAGVDIDAAVAAIGAPLSPYRYSFWAARAAQLCGEVRNLGGAVLAALEKHDAEHLARLRTDQEAALLELVLELRRSQVEEAKANVAALVTARETAASRYRHFQYLLTGGQVHEPAEQSPVVEEPSRLPLVPSANLDADVRGLGLVRTEVDQLGWQAAAGTWAVASGVANTAAGVLFSISAFNVFMPTLSGLGHAANAVGSFLGALSGNADRQATRTGAIAGFQRRVDDWRHQSNSALRELAQVDKQLAAARIRVAITEHELTNHRRQIADAHDVAAFMHDKYTNEQLYTWMSGQLNGAYFAAYQLALDMARRAERAMRFELYLPQASFIRTGQWDSLRRGLLAGEQLTQDLHRMDVAYLDRNLREHELTRHVSLRRIDPVAWLRLRATGRCDVAVPEQLFDADFPGHFLRRLKSVGLTLPCVVGPNTAVHARLTLLSSTVRHRADGGAGYERDLDADDPRFTDDFGPVESVVTSGTVDATGVWEPNLRDDRRLPFEGRGAISTWRVELPASYPQFDHDSIADAILTLRYSARDGGSRLRDVATEALNTAFARFVDQPLAAVVSLRHDYASEWARFTAPGTGSRSATFPITMDRFPFMFSRRHVTVRSLEILSAPVVGESLTAGPALTAVPVREGDPQPAVTATAAAPIGSLVRTAVDELEVEVAASDAAAGWTLTAPEAVRTALRDVTLVLTYTASAVTP
ncbi:hypothetical protein Vau01_025180 [Virgisporangium aurantiacum]|uniref:Virulence plasmid A protein n=1 Tax=Virgisporangium aurantiacum TaxID=175570 RepID=A0A8J4E0G6_9ACTN|nr:hypothetical protein Vau01_025180 [Virgisporangium aurantiacum]